jgi:hypothetical protein
MALSELVYEKTKGNPFYTISFLTKLHQTGLIVRTPLMVAGDNLTTLTCTMLHAMMPSGSITARVHGDGTWTRRRQWATQTMWSSSWRSSSASCPSRCTTHAERTESALGSPLVSCVSGARASRSGGLLWIAVRRARHR